ncbi:hypothetical protein BGZ90_007734 [Linnemannia elongata]|nr:hypothetical protein BGZ90_007734 [Linnemannia elongata]
MKLLPAVLVGAFAAISIAHGTKWVDPDPERAARVAGYVACIGPCLQEAVTDPNNGPCHLNKLDPKKCLTTLIPQYLPCVQRCTGRAPTQPVNDTASAPAGYLEDDYQVAFGLDYF